MNFCLEALKLLDVFPSDLEGVVIIQEYRFIRLAQLESHEIQEPMLGLVFNVTDGQGPNADGAAAGTFDFRACVVRA